MKHRSISTIILAFSFGAIIAPLTSAAVEGDELVFTTPDGWRGETLAIPPGFAPDMKLKGTEVIRFAPGMFDPKSDSFFSYILVFSLASEEALTEKQIRDEILVYYRGLAKSVLAGKGKETDTEKFSLKIRLSAKALHVPVGAGKHTVSEYHGVLDWVEPFATAKPQKLNFEIHSWFVSKSKRAYLVVCASPKPTGEKEAIWVDLRKIRAHFAIKSKPAK
jgi:hypothetical protein